MANAQAYYSTELITSVKCFMIQALGVLQFTLSSHIMLFIRNYNFVNFLRLKSDNLSGVYCGAIVDGRF